MSPELLCVNVAYWAYTIRNREQALLDLSECKCVYQHSTILLLFSGLLWRYKWLHLEKSVMILFCGSYYSWTQQWPLITQEGSTLCRSLLYAPMLLECDTAGTGVSPSISLSLFLPSSPLPSQTTLSLSRTDAASLYLSLLFFLNSSFHTAARGLTAQSLHFSFTRAHWSDYTLPPTAALKSALEATRHS